MRKVKWHKVLGLMLTVALTVTSLPQGMSTVRAEETTKTEVNVSPGDAVEDIAPVETLEQVEEELPQFKESALDSTIQESVTLEVYNSSADFVIRNTVDMITFSNEIRNGNSYSGKTVKLGANIVFDGITVNNFTPIGTDDNYFNGTFDGAGHTISGLIIVDNTGSDFCGLFRRIGSDGLVKNLTVSNSEFTASNADYLGGIVGYNQGSVYNCVVSNSEITNADVDAGGIAGLNESMINMCRVLNSTVEGYANTGGIVGICYYGKIQNCLSTAHVQSSGSISRCDTGGICGQIEDCEITNCANLGVVSGYAQYIGGITSYTYGTCVIQNCYNAGEVKNDANAGKNICGLVAECRDNTVLANCYYNTSTATGWYTSHDSVITRNNECMLLNDMKKAAFADRLNTNSASNGDWVPWEIRSGLDYPQHVSTYEVSLEDTSYGTISIDKEYAYKGLKVNFSVTPYSYYTVSSVNVKTSAGNSVSVSGSKGNYSFTMPAANVKVKVVFKYSKPITECSVTPNKTSYSYDGSAKKPAVTVMDGLKKLVSGTDYTLSYSNNVNAGTGKIIVKGKGNYTGSTSVTFSIKQASQGLSVTKTSYTKTYGNSAFSLGAKTKKGPGKFTYKSSDTSVAAVNSKGTVTIKGTGYTKITVTATGNTNLKKESKTVTLIVQPKKQKVSAVQPVKGSGLKIAWTKDAKAHGYKVEYSKDKKKWSTKNLSGFSQNSITITKLTPGAVYYIRVRSYVKANGKTYYGEYSNVEVSDKIKAYMEETAITLSKTSYEYDGKRKKPSVKVTYGGKKLKTGKDYAVSYSNNIKAGTAKVTITGKGNYSGKVTKTFKIKKITPTFTGTTYYYKTEGDKAFTLNTELKKGKGFTQLIYKSSDTNVVSVDNKGKVTVKGPGKAVITVTAKGSQNCNEATRKINIKVYSK